MASYYVDTGESHLVTDSVVKPDVIDHPADHGARVGAGLHAPGYLRAPVPDSLAPLQLPLGAGRDGLTLHHVSGVAVELDHLADRHGHVGVDEPVFGRRHFFTHDRPTHRRRRFVHRPLAGLPTDGLIGSVQDVAAAAGEVGDAAGGKAVNVDLEVALRHGGDVFRADDVHAGRDGRAPAAPGGTLDLLHPHEAVAVGAAEPDLGVQRSVALGEAQALGSDDIGTNHLQDETKQKLRSLF